MKHFASSGFWRCFALLPATTQALARRNYSLLRDNPEHPSLHFKLVSDGRYRSVRVGIHYRALGIPVPDGVVWFWIGSHADYDRLVG